MSLTITHNIHDPNIIKVKSSFRSVSAPISSALTNTLSLWENNSIETEISLLDKIFSFVDYSVVYNFLKRNKFIIPLLFESYGEILSVFGTDTDLLLEVKKDDESEKLYIFIGTDNSDAYDLLDELDESWWIDAIPRSNHKMNIDLEY